MSQTLSDLIATAISGSEDAEESQSEEAGIQKEAGANGTAADLDLAEAEKLASVLEFIGRTGVSNMLKTAGASDPPSGVDTSPAKKDTKKKQIQPHAGAPPMAEPGYGLLPNNEGQKPGGGEAQNVKPTTGSHHPSLTSNEAAIGMKKKDKTRLVNASLQAVLDQKPFADGRLAEMLSHTDEDKNINKTAAEQKLAGIRAELARRAAAGTTAQEVN